MREGFCLGRHNDVLALAVTVFVERLNQIILVLARDDRRRVARQRDGTTSMIAAMMIMDSCFIFYNIFFDVNVLNSKDIKFCKLTAPYPP